MFYHSASLELRRQHNCSGGKVLRATNRSARIAGPLHPQLYRVRATCLRDGQAITGQSEFFELTPAQTTFIADVFPSNLDPIPTRISVSAPADFVALGATVQLSVTAYFADGTTDDRTLRTKGTTYLSTNPNLLSVTEDGLVTGQNTTRYLRTGTIAVLNEGNIGTINFIAVGPSNDFDSDGMPNDFEDLFGLNKLVNDANFDLDSDGLTNIVEFNLGTIPNNPDTDGDGITDGIDGNPLHPEESPPTVVVTSPTDGDTVVEGETIIFAVDSTDDGLLASVELSTDTGFSQTFTTPPFDANFTIPVDVTQIVFSATATDGVPNVTTSLPVTVSVIVDCNRNDIPDADEIAAGAPDCNGNGIPDECELGGADLIVNGGFETQDFSGWTQINSGSGGIAINDGSLDPPGPDGPSPPCDGTVCSVTFQSGPGQHTLYQEVSIPPLAGTATLSWIDRIRNHAGVFSDPNQEFRVEVWDTNNVPIVEVFSTDPGDPLLNDCEDRTFDISAFIGQTVRIAFTQQDNLSFFNAHLDNVSLIVGTGGSGDCNGNGIPDECDEPDPNTIGACCTNPLTEDCLVDTESACNGTGGSYRGDCTTCADGLCGPGD